MANDTVWIIVPVYNAEKTLKKCVRSIQKQTYKNWRLVLVDDGSKDKSGAMCDKFAEKDDRITVIHQANAGSSIARKIGIEQIPNEGYCIFCDSDDVLPKCSLTLLIKECNKTEADIVCGLMKKMARGIRLPDKNIPLCYREPKSYLHEQIMSELYISCFGVSNFPVSLWGKLYKSEVLKKVMLAICDAPIFFSDDWNVMVRLLPVVNKISIIDDVVYYYRIGGGTSKFMPTFLEDSLFVYEKKREYCSLYTGSEDIRQLTVIDLKNVVLTYLAMCERFQHFPKGNLKKEFEYIFSLPQVKEIIPYLGDSTDEKAIANNDFMTIELMVKERASAINRRENIKKLLLG